MDGRAAGALAAEAADDYIGSGTEVSNYFHISDLTNYAGRGVPAWRDHCYFGLLREDDYSPKPSYSAMQTLATMLSDGVSLRDDSGFVMRDESDGGRTLFGCRKIFAKGNRPILAHCDPVSIFDKRRYSRASNKLLPDLRP